MSDTELKKLQNIAEEQIELLHTLKETLDKAWEISNRQEQLRLESLSLMNSNSSRAAKKQ